MKNKSDFTYIIVFLILFLCLFKVSATTVSIPYVINCNPSIIKGITCENMIDSKIVPIGINPCQINAIVGKCVLKNESETLREYYSDCEINVQGTDPKVISGIFSIENDTLPNGDGNYTYYTTFNFSKLGDVYLYFSFPCNNNRGDLGVWPKDYKVVSYDEFWSLEKIDEQNHKIENQNDLNIKTAIASGIIAILSLIVTILTLVMSLKKQKIVICDIDSKVFNKLIKLSSDKDRNLLKKSSSTIKKR